MSGFHPRYRGVEVGLVCLGLLGGFGCREAGQKNQAPLWTESTAWSIGPERLRVGAHDTLPGHSLFRVRMALRHPDGRIIVVDGGSNEIRIFDAAGTLLKALGGSGPGPEQFGALAALWLAPGDTLVTYDVGSVRLLAWPLDGGSPRNIDVDVSRRPAIYGRYDSGAILMGYPDAMQRREPGTQWIDSVDVVVAAGPEGAEHDVGRFPHATMFAAPAPGGGSRAIYTGMPYSGQAAIAVGPSYFYYGFGEDWTIIKYAESGAVIDTVRRAGTPPAFSEAMLNTLIAERVAMVPPEQAPDMRSFMAAFPWPARLPAFQSLQVDDAGCLWVQPPLAPGGDAGFWTVFSSNNRWLGEVEIPNNVRPTHIGADFMLAIETNGDGVEQVVLYALDQPQGTTCASD